MDRLLVSNVKSLLEEKGIHLHWLSEKEMTIVIGHPATAMFQVFHGDRSLYEMFQEKYNTA